MGSKTVEADRCGEAIGVKPPQSEAGCPRNVQGERLREVNHRGGSEVRGSNFSRSFCKASNSPRFA
jgi:hypothetical protein